MRDVARMALENGMIIGEDIYNYQNELVIPRDTTVDARVIKKLERHSIICVPVKEEIDFATTHFEKVRLSLLSMYRLPGRRWGCRSLNWIKKYTGWMRRRL